MSSFKCSCESSNQHLQFGWCVVSLQEHANSRVCLGTTYSLDADEQGHAVVTDGRLPVLVPHLNAATSPEGVLNVALEAHKLRPRVSFDARVLQGDADNPGTYFVQLNAYICNLDRGADTLTAVDVGTKTPNVVRLLYHYMELCIRPVPVSQESLQALVLPHTLSMLIDPHTWRVSNLYKSLPSCTRVQYIPPAATSNGHARFPLLDLPLDVLQRLLQICAQQSGQTLRALEQTCRTLRSLAAAVVPGCSLQLFRHQQHALQWMVIREQSRLRVPAGNRALWFPFAAGVGGVVLVLKTPRKEVLAHPERLLQADCRGGLLTDEPGLGKTITALALVLKTKGMMPRVPRNALVIEYPPLVQADGTSTQRVAYVAPPEVEEDKRQQRTGLTPLIMQCREVFPKMWVMLRAQAAEDTTALTPEEAAHIINTERTMLMDLLASVGKDCSILQRMVQEEEEDANMQQMEDDVVVEQEVDVAMEDAAAPAEGVDAVPPVERAATPGALPSPPHALLNVHDGVALDSNPGYGVLDGWLGERNTSSMLVRCKLCSKTRVVPNEEYVAFLQRHMTREDTPNAAIAQTPWGWLWGARHWCCLDSSRRPTCGKDDYYPYEYNWGLSMSQWRSHIGYYKPSEEAPAQPRNILMFCQMFAKDPGHFAGYVPKGAAANAPLVHLLRCDEETFATRGVAPYDGIPPHERYKYGVLFDENQIRAHVVHANGSRTPPTNFKAPPGFTSSGLRFDAAALRCAVLYMVQRYQATGSPVRMPPLRLLSPASIIVAPPNLLDHWSAQLTKVGQNPGRVFDFRRGPFVFSRGTLAWEHDVVLVQRETFSNKLSDTDTLMSHWQRIIVDEGHIIGSVSSIRFEQLRKVPAERRWIMTGTPTPGLHGAATSMGPSATTQQQSQDEQQAKDRLKHETEALSKHLQFLRVPQASAATSQGLGRWETPAHRVLQRLLCGVMIRASKADVEELPPLTKQVVTLDFDAHHADSYNQLLALLRVNLITSDWLDQNHSEALTHVHNSKRMKQFFNNLIQSCNVTGNMDVCCTAGDVIEVLQMLSDWRGIEIPEELKAIVPTGPEYRTSGHKPPNLVWLPPSHQLYDIQQALLNGGQCDCCARQAPRGGAAPARERVLVVTPCLHLLCVEHADACGAPGDESFHCPVDGCSHSFVMQEVDDPLRYKHNQKPQWPVPVQLIELQPAWAQRGAMGVTEGAWSGAWEQGVAGKVQRLLQDLQAVGCIASVQESMPYSALQLAQLPHAVRTVLVAKAREEGVVLDEQGDGTSGPRAGGARGGGVANGKQPIVTCFHPRSKAIVFSRHVNHLYLLMLGLAARGANARLLVRSETAAIQRKVLNEFRNDDTIGVLLMDESGAVGLDLSCASHVFLMEPVLETDLEQQIVARAWRLGNGQAHGNTKPPVSVTTYAMGGGSIEEAMLTRALPARELKEVYGEILMGLQRVKV